MVTEYKVRSGQKLERFKSKSEEQARAVYEALVGAANWDTQYHPYYDLVKLESSWEVVDEDTVVKTIRITVLEKTK